MLQEVLLVYYLRFYFLESVPKYHVFFVYTINLLLADKMIQSEILSWRTVKLLHRLTLFQTSLLVFVFNCLDWWLRLFFLAFPLIYLIIRVDRGGHFYLYRFIWREKDGLEYHFDRLTFISTFFLCLWFNRRIQVFSALGMCPGFQFVFKIKVTFVF